MATAMYGWILLVTAIVVITSNDAYADEFNCPDGQRIYFKGVLSNEYREIIVNTHNNYRSMIAEGKVENQPRGMDLLRMQYDDVLAAKARAVSMQCEVNHLEIVDERFKVGQNVYLEMSSEFDTLMTQNWADAITAWFDEHEYYSYGAGLSTQTGHYTQVVWADTFLVGCDFIMYRDYRVRHTPYHKLYTCNYGPAGNWMGDNPYKVNGSACESADGLCDSKQRAARHC